MIAGQKWFLVVLASSCIKVRTITFGLRVKDVGHRLNVILYL